jgi:hypothetical protein
VEVATAFCWCPNPALRSGGLMSDAGERLCHVLLPVRASRANSNAEAAAGVGDGAGALVKTSITRRTTGVRGYSVGLNQWRSRPGWARCGAALDRPP